ncbi:flavodoxin family protein [Aquimarina sp. AD10]|uniref:NAD(P)H-dependent oxidoreductase n=1 Tax=Aquimarina sp. AD10 TaxID=1714849 RepID=UPI000E51F4EB|nr:NAD(P)H-dependent oxidoreductase [Aquimarina sp. AD10]AXT63363.1 flavodoxin family protein [Aquimarina sp. AD10]RKN00624.1 flavodoxin family protein [Aquimarina sp. AD10]
MNVLIIYCHPSKKSYTHQILQQLKKVLKNESIKFEISDLYEMNFQTEMTEQEYMREGLLNLDLPIPEDVQKEQEKIENADCIIFLYPVWWSDCPAKLKGWFDRVYTVGYAYGYDKAEKENKKMKTVKYGISLCTAGHPNMFLDEIGIAESMRNIMIDDRLGQRFSNKELIILGGTLDRKKVEKDHSKIVKNIPKRIKKYCA